MIRNKIGRMNRWEVAHLGGLARQAKYGDLGTLEGRRRGGINSLVTHYSKKTGFKLLRKVVFPKESKHLAELLGIIAGDGHIGVYQVSITTNSQTDIEHAKYVQSLFGKLFSLSARMTRRSKTRAVVVTVSSKEVCRFLVLKGMVSGNKIRGGVRIPTWIHKHRAFENAFARGLFDTDGCVYVDTHRIKRVIYRNLGMTFTNHSLPLLADFKFILKQRDLRPTQKTKYTVFLRRRSDIRKYFGVIGSSNPKHLRKVSEFFTHKGGVPKWS